MTDALAAALQPALDQLQLQGVDKIILLSHLQQVDIEISLLGKLSGVDVIVAGGSGGTLFDIGSTLETNDDIFVSTNKDGEAAYVVSVEDVVVFNGNFMDWEFREGTVIWTGKGRKKYDDPTYLNAKRMMALK